jgi:hypothetical protein
MPSKVLDKGIYFRRVLAKSDGSAGPWSSSMRFFINDHLAFEGNAPLSPGKVGLSDYAGDGGGFRVDHAMLITGSPIVGGLESGQLEVSDEQKKLNEAALGEKINQTPNGLNSGIVGLN